MKEDFLHFIWRFQYFRSKTLSLVDGQTLHVFSTGYQNFDSGPDFLEARLKIGEIEWAGNVEIHIKASDWNKHTHQNDAAYNNVILHVVWIADEVIFDSNRRVIPTFEIKNLVDTNLVNTYKGLVQSIRPIACEHHFLNVRPITKLSMIEAALMGRLEERAREILALHSQLDGDWPQTTLTWLFRNFGFRVNADAFQALGKSISWKWIAWHQNNSLQLEALLFGMAGFLQAKPESDYQFSLHREWEFLRHKYRLEGRELKAEIWKFLRLRPANFPTLRMAELAAFLKKCPQPYETLESLPNKEQLDHYFQVNLSSFWQNHYHFRKQSKVPHKGIGKLSRDLLIINWAAPLVFALGLERSNDDYKECALKWLQTLSPEKNVIIDNWKALGLNPSHAFDSQGLIGLYKDYCTQKRCLSCKIGIEVLNKPS
jgi:hypothetical protein